MGIIFKKKKTRFEELAEELFGERAKLGAIKDSHEKESMAEIDLKIRVIKQNINRIVAESSLLEEKENKNIIDLAERIKTQFRNLRKWIAVEKAKKQAVA